MSPAYPMFEVFRTEELMPEFLMMWFSRKEFDREVTFWAVGGVRGSLTWEDFENLKIPVPAIEEQRRIVAEYQAIERRIENNRRLVAALESAARAIYRRLFVDNIDPANLPPGWRLGTIADVMTISSGKTLSDKSDAPTDEYKYPVAGASGIIGYAKEFNQSDRCLTTGRVGTIGVVNRYLEPAWAADNVLVAKSKYFEFAYQALCHVNYEGIKGGGVQSLITQTNLSSYPLVIPHDRDIETFETQSQKLTSECELAHRESLKLKEILSLLLTKLSKLA